MALTSPADVYRERIRRAQRHIEAHLDEPISLDDLAAVACFSRFHFHRVFTGMVGETVMEHVRRLRLERAASQLKLTRRAVLEIAFDAGYETQESFTRAFKAAFGMPPASYRKAKDPTTRLPPKEAMMNETPDVKIEERPPLRAATVLHTGPYDRVDETWERLIEAASDQDLLAPEALMFGMSYDDPDVTPAVKIRYRACCSVPAGAVVAPPLELEDVPAGRFAVALHQGPYDRLGHTYAAVLGGWFPGSGLEPDPGPCIEIYCNDPNVEAPEELLTRVMVRIREGAPR